VSAEIDAWAVLGGIEGGVILYSDDHRVAAVRRGVLMTNEVAWLQSATVERRESMLEIADLVFGSV
jgi:hypothetical protein